MFRSLSAVVRVLFTIRPWAGSRGAVHCDVAKRAGERAAPHFDFILQPEFPLNGLLLASDALRIANQNSGKTMFSWSFVSELGGQFVPVTACG